MLLEEISTDVLIYELTTVSSHQKLSNWKFSFLNLKLSSPCTSRSLLRKLPEDNANVNFFRDNQICSNCLQLLIWAECTEKWFLHNDGHSAHSLIGVTGLQELHAEHWHFRLHTASVWPSSTSRNLIRTRWLVMLHKRVVFQSRPDLNTLSCLHVHGAFWCTYGDLAFLIDFWWPPSPSILC